MRKTKAQKGITLIALIITIIVLLILAVVSIRAIQGDGIIAKARQAAAEYNQAQINEINKMSEFAALITEKTENGAGSTTAVDISEAGVVLSTTETTTVIDAKGNIIKVPAGFKIVNTSDTVDKGIVIEDVSAGNAGSQFVWVPVGTITKGDGTPETVELKRYIFNRDGTINEGLTKTNPGDQLRTSASVVGYFTEGLKDSTTVNTHAKDIEGFIRSANTNGGYYIGRYEASESGETIACKLGQTVYGNISQPGAADKCRDMYDNAKPFTSDLVNSYAWDTAIVFIQKCSTETNYANANKSSDTLELKATGQSNDEYCNINDMSGNLMEWTTETGSGNYPCICRGGFFDTLDCDWYNYTSSRNSDTVSLECDTNSSFRPLLYL